MEAHSSVCSWKVSAGRSLDLHREQSPWYPCTSELVAFEQTMERALTEMTKKGTEIHPDHYEDFAADGDSSVPKLVEHIRSP